MGDVLSLIEKAEQAIDEKKAMEQLEKMKSQQFDLNDFLENLQQLKGMGSMQDILKMLPGGNKLAGMEVDESQFKADGGDYLLYDDAGAADARHPQRQPPQAYRAGQRHERAGCQPTTQSI